MAITSVYPSVPPCSRVTDLFMPLVERTKTPSPLSPFSPFDPATPGSPMGPGSPLGPSMPIAPGKPGLPGSPGGPGGPSSPISPFAPRLPRRPGGPGGHRQAGSTSRRRLRRLAARNADESWSAAWPSLRTSSWYVRSSKLATFPSRAFTLNKHNASIPSAITSTATKLNAIQAGTNHTLHGFLTAASSFAQTSVVLAVPESDEEVCFILAAQTSCSRQ